MYDIKLKLKQNATYRSHPIASPYRPSPIRFIASHPTLFVRGVGSFYCLLGDMGCYLVQMHTFLVAIYLCYKKVNPAQKELKENRYILQGSHRKSNLTRSRRPRL